MKKRIKLKLKTKIIIALVILALIAMAVISFIGIGGVTKMSSSDKEIVAEYMDNSDICTMGSKGVIRLCRKNTSGDYEFIHPKKHLHRYKSLISVVKGKKTAVVRYKSKDKYEVTQTFNKKGLVEICIYDTRKDILLYQSGSRQVKYRHFADRRSLEDILKIKE